MPCIHNKMRAIKISIQVICLLLVLFIVPGCIDKSPQVQMKATKGELDLSQWDFDKDGTVTLEGEWDFYWNQFLSYEEIIAKKSSIDTYLKVPGVWKDLKVGNSVLPGDGFITIHLLVKLSKAFENLAIKIPEIGTAYKIWINETLIHEGGKIGKTREAMTAFVIPEVVSLNLSKEKEIHITIQISNFMDRTGGVWGDFSFGKANEIYRITNIIFSLETMVFGGLFIMSVYHFGLFLIRTQDKSTLFFGLFCLDFGIRTLIVGQKILIYTFPFLPFDLTFRLDYLTAYLAFPFFISFLYYLFKEETNRNYIRITWVCFFFLCLTVIILPHFEYTQFLIPYELYVLFSIPYIIYVNLSAIRNKRVGSISSFIGVLILAGGSITDMLHIEHIIFWHFLFPFTLFGFLFFQSFSLSIKFSKAFTLSENLTIELTQKTNSLTTTNKELNELKTDLEEKVQERSIALEEVYRKNYYEIQRASSLEKELAVQKERQKIFVDIHDHMGSNILDLKNSLSELSQSIPDRTDNLEKAKQAIYKLEDNLRMKMYSIEDLEILRKDPLNGIRLLVIRRYATYDREINFFCEEALYDITENRFSNKLIEVLFSISQENGTNDLKYGYGLSEWKFLRYKENICLEIISPTGYTIDHKGAGNGKRNIAIRLREIGGYDLYCEDKDKFHSRFYFPFFK